MARAHSKVLRIAVIAALAAAGALAGCGQRGPLYLPDSQPKKKLALDIEPIAPDTAASPTVPSAAAANAAPRTAAVPAAQARPAPASRAPG